MAQNSRAKNKKRNNEDQVLRTSVMIVIILFIVGAAIVGIKSLNPRPDTSEGMDKLKEMEQIKVSEVESEIAVLDEEEAKAIEEKGKRSNKEIFKDTVVLGDFIAQGLYEQEVLGESFVFAKESACVHDLETTGVTESLNAAAEKKPKVVFLEFGVNDAALDGSNADVFEDDYKTFLNQVQEKLPDTKIFVNSILPVQQKAVEESQGLANIAEYNERLKALCKESGVIFLDNSSLVKEDYYKDDGKHMKKKYYTAWAKQMAEAADL